MEETDDQREQRRAISRWLTKQLNDYQHANNNWTPQGMSPIVPSAPINWQQVFAEVRLRVIAALNDMNEGFRRALRELRLKHNLTYHLIDETYGGLVSFYMKGGNAYECVKEGQPGLAAGGGDSDWDTQLVLDPWSPVPIQEMEHGVIEGVVLDQLEKAGDAIAWVMQGETNYDPSTQPSPAPERALITYIKERWEADRQAKIIKNVDFSNYNLTYPDQSIRHIFSHDKLGLLFVESNAVKKHSDGIDKKLIPGMSFNDRLPPFIIYRLGYIWKAEQNAAYVPPAHPAPSTKAADLVVSKSILMELIDITIPRRNTVEGVRVWDEIETSKIKLGEKRITVGEGTGVPLRFPDITYHLREQLDMLCEVADGSSSHKDKMDKRFSRMNEIFTYIPEDKARTIISNQVGTDIQDERPTAPIPITRDLEAIISKWSGNDLNLFDLSDSTVNPKPGTHPGYRYGIMMMDTVIRAVIERRADLAGYLLSRESDARIEAGRTAVVDNGWLAPLSDYVSGPNPSGWSDDMVLQNAIFENNYIRFSQIGCCHIDQAMVTRVKSYKGLKRAVEALKTKVH